MLRMTADAVRRSFLRLGLALLFVGLLVSGSGCGSKEAPNVKAAGRPAPAKGWAVIVHYFRPNPNLLAGESHVNVVITQHAGTDQETTERHNVILKRHDEQVEVAKVKF
jgi:hypothetical protein